MKLLLDANLSWKLNTVFVQHFKDCIHVNDLSIPQPAKDIEIWNYALDNGFVIVTNDEDFLNLSNVRGFPPKVILLKTGNQSTTFIIQLIISHKQELEDFYTSAEYGFLEIF